MFSKLRHIILLSLIFSTSPTFTKAMESGIEEQQQRTIPLTTALKEGKSIAIFNCNDCFTDADSIQALIEALLLSSRHREQITQYFVTDDETYASSIPENTKYAYRAQDTATLLFPLADKLGLYINVIQGEVSTNPTYNPYFGNCGVGYKDQDLHYINRIHSETGSKAVIAAMKKEISEGKRLYLLSGGSFRLLSDLQEMARDILPCIDVTVMGFRQPMNFPPFTNPDRRWSPSWNEGIDRNSTEKFIAFASQATNPKFGAFRIVDSNTVEYGMVCNGTMFPLYKDYMSKLKPVVSEAAYKNLLDAEAGHEKWSGFKTKFMDPIIVFDAFGLVSIPRSQGHLIESRADFCLRSTGETGFPALYPDIEGKHPFSCPRTNAPSEENPEYAIQYQRVVELREQLKKAHQETWGLF